VSIVTVMRRILNKGSLWFKTRRGRSVSVQSPPGHEMLDGTGVSAEAGLQEQSRGSATAVEEAFVLKAERFGVAIGTRVILAELDFQLPCRGVTVLLGPMGCGKSTLLRSLACLTVGNRRFSAWGRVEFRGRLLTESNCPALVAQNAQLLSSRIFDNLASRLRQQSNDRSPAELREWIVATLYAFGCGDLISALDELALNRPRVDQCRIALLREAAVTPELLLIDEPTAGLDEADARTVLQLIKKIAGRSAVFLVLHNQTAAREFADRVLLLAGGRMQADASSQDFFERPAGDVAKWFVRTAGSPLPSPDAKAEDLEEGVEPPPPLPMTAKIAVKAIPEYRGPSGFRWIIPGRLGATPLPGIVTDLDYDLACLRMLGITTLITLTHRDLDQDALRRQGLRNFHLGISDNEPPSIPQMRALAGRMSELLHNGETLAVHCRAGLGRTGTVVAGWLMCDGLPAQLAIQRIRNIDSRFVQTASQEQFLFAWEKAMHMPVHPTPRLNEEEIP